MERLTLKDICENCIDEYYNHGCKKPCYKAKLYRKLKHYEDLEEQGLLIKLPAKVGAAVYIPDDEPRNGYTELQIDEGVITGFGFDTEFDCFVTTPSALHIFQPEEFDKTIFLDYRKAKVKLKENKTLWEESLKEIKRE